MSRRARRQQHQRQRSLSLASPLPSLSHPTFSELPLLLNPPATPLPEPLLSYNLQLPVSPQG
ncbi:unnamed protein product, partial [Closterium sp. NIES-54]